MTLPQLAQNLSILKTILRRSRFGLVDFEIGFQTLTEDSLTMKKIVLLDFLICQKDVSPPPPTSL